MAMDIQTPYLAIRTALAASAVTAWSVSGNVRFDPPQVPPTSADLPKCFIQLENVSPQRSVKAAGFGQSSAILTFTIVGQFANPTTEEFETAKMSKAQALLSLLTATSTVYATYRYQDPQILFSDVLMPDSTEQYYEVKIVFPVEVIVSA